MDNCNCEQALALKEAYLELWEHVVHGSTEENFDDLYSKVLELTKEEKK